MSDQVPLTISYTDQQRIGWAAHQVGRSSRKFLEDLIHELAAEYPLPPDRAGFAARKAERIAELARTHTPSKIARHYGTDTEVIQTILGNRREQES